MANQNWSTMASNQSVDWSGLSSAIAQGYLPSGGTAITLNDPCVYKSLATLTNYVNINTGGTYASRGSNQSLWKSDFVSALSTGTAVTIYAYSVVIKGFTVVTGQASSAAACTAGTGAVAFTVYTTGATFGNGVVLYASTTGGGWGSTTIDTTTYYYYSSFTFQVTWNSTYNIYTVTNYTSCNSFNLQVGSTKAAACYSPITTVTATSDTGSYCTTNVFTSSAFSSLSTGTSYYVSYLGQTLNIFYSGTPTNQVTVYSGGCSSCPTSTTTTSTSTTTSSTTTTTTTSTTTAAPNATISLFAEAQATLTPNPSVRFYYQVGAGAWTLIGTVSVGTGGYSTITTSLSVPKGSSLKFAARNSTGANDVTFGSGTSTPPPSYTGFCGERLPYTATSNVTGNASYYLGISVSGGAVITC